MGYAKINCFILVGQVVHKRLSLSLNKTSKSMQKSCNTYNEFKSFEEEWYLSSICPDYMKYSSNWNNLCHDFPSSMHEEVMLLHKKILRGKVAIDMFKHDLSNISTNIRVSIDYLENQIHHFKTGVSIISYVMGLCSLMKSKLHSCLLMETCEKNGIYF